MSRRRVVPSWRRSVRYGAMASAAAVAVLAATVVGPARPAQAVPIGLCSPTPQTGSGCAQAVDTVQGLDVSNYQNARGTINWTSVKNAGQSFVFIKATEGKTVTDSSYATNDSGTKAAGLLRGAYHFGRPDSSAGDALAEARYFVGVTGTSLSGQLPPVLDLEDDGGLSDAALVTWAKTYLAEVERLTGRVPVIYTGPSFWQTETGNSTEFTRHPLWIAQYTSGTPTVPGGWPNYTFWQNTSSYTVSGITGVVDHDYFHGTLSQLQALADGASVNPYSPTGVCGSGYEIIDQAALADAGTVYLLYNSASGSNCVVTLKQTSLGTASAVSAYLEVEGSTRVTDSGSYGYYAGPVRAAAAGACVKWGGSAGAATYDSAFEHCG